MTQQVIVGGKEFRLTSDQWGQGPRRSAIHDQCARLTVELATLLLTEAGSLPNSELLSNYYCLTAVFIRWLSEPTV